MLEDKLREGHPSISVNDENSKCVHATLAVKRWLKIKMSSEELGISVGSIHTIVCDVLRRQKPWQVYTH